MVGLATERAAARGMRSAAKLDFTRMDALQVFGLSLVPLTSLLVAPSLGYGNEAYMVGKTLVLALVAVVAAATLLRLKQVRLTLADGLLGLYFLHGLVAACAGDQPLSMASVALLPEFSAGLVVAAVAVGTHQSPARRGVVLDVIVAGAAVVALIALAEALGMPLPWEGARRPHSTLGNRNFVGAEAAIAAVIVFGRFVAQPAAWRALCLGLLVVTVGITRCRSAWLGSLLAVVVVLAAAYLLRRKLGAAAAQPKKRSVGLAATIVALAMVTAALVPWPGLAWTDQNPIRDTLGRVAEYKSGTGRERLGDLGIAASLAAESPLLGVGPRSWDDAASMLAHQVPMRHATPQNYWSTPNSDLARTLGERGVLGLGLLLAAVVALVDAAWRAASARPYLDSLTLVGALTVFGVNALFDAPLFRPSSLLLAALLVGLLRDSTEARVLTLSRRSWASSLALLAAVLLVGTTLRVAAAATIASDPENLDGLRRAQHLFWRTDVAELLALRLARKDQCEEAERVGVEALAASPHHWGVPHALAMCWGARGEHHRARLFAQQRDAIEPHVELLYRTGADLPSGYEKP